jgi:hypothetical protein
MTQQEMTIDRLYDEAFDAIHIMRPTPLRDFVRVGTWSTVTIQLQILAQDKFSVRITGSDLKRPFYAQGTKQDILFTLRQNIKNVMDSTHEQASPWAPPQTEEIAPFLLTQDQLDAIYNLPKGRP